VRKSSTWAVCQEFLGKLSDDDLEYSQQRGGLWAINPGSSSPVSVREVLQELFYEFPDPYFTCDSLTESEEEYFDQYERLHYASLYEEDLVHCDCYH